MKIFLRRIYANDRSLQVALLVFMVFWYGAILAISWRLSLSEPTRLTFNSMLDHLLRGQFDVDPQIIGREGYVRNGRVYAYFGIWCALLRLPLKVAGRMQADITFWSCLTAVCIAGMAKVRAVLLIRHDALATSIARYATGLLLAYILLAGSAVAYLQLSVYMEAVLWAYAFAAIFVYLALQGIIRRSFRMGTLNAMAACAGLALLTRVSTRVGLIAAFLGLLLLLALKPSPVSAKEDKSRSDRVFTQPLILVPIGILGSLMAVTGVVNYFRWGNPATFVNYDLYIMRTDLPNFVASLHKYGAFNFRRIPFGLIYYFLPVWVLPGRNLLSSTMQSPLFGIIYAPPSSFLLTDLLAIGFIVLLLVAVWTRRRHALPLLQCGAIAVGLSVPCVLILSLSWMIYRYRVEFYPAIEFLAMLGLYLTVTSEEMLAKFRRYRIIFNASLLVSIAASAFALALYDIDVDIPAEETLRPGIVHYYLDKARRHLHRLPIVTPVPARDMTLDPPQTLVP